MKTQWIFILFFISLLFAVEIFAQSGPPGSTASYTLEDLYNRLFSGTLGAARSFTEPASAPGTKVMHSINEILGRMPIPDNTNGATKSDVTSGKTFWGLRTDGTWGLQTGTAVVSSLVHKVGDTYDGGIIFLVDKTGEHGLIAAPADESGTHDWDEAFFICNYNGWYLPSIGELKCMYQQRALIGGFAADYYWSSSQKNGAQAYILHFGAGQSTINPKTTPRYVRGVRSF